MKRKKPYLIEDFYCGFFVNKKLLFLTQHIQYFRGDFESKKFFHVIFENTFCLIVGYEILLFNELSSIL